MKSNSRTVAPGSNWFEYIDHQGIGLLQELNQLKFVKTFIIIIFALLPVFSGIISNLLTGGKFADFRKSVIFSFLLLAITLIGVYLSDNVNKHNMPGDPIAINNITNINQNILPNKPSYVVKQDKNISSQSPVVETNPQSKTTVESRTFISDYILIGSNTNQIENIISDIQTNLEEKGNTVTFSNEVINFPAFKGKYKNLIMVDTRITGSRETSIDARLINTRFSCLIKIYDIETGKLINAINETDSETGFSESENIEKIRKLIITKLKSLL